MQGLEAWIISTLLSIIGLMSGGVLWYVANIFKKAEGLDNEIKRNNQKITALREHLNENISKIYSSQQSVGGEIINLRRTLVSTTVVIRRRKAEADRIMEDTKRTQDKLEEIGRELESQKQTLATQQGSLVKLAKGLILVKGEKKEES